MFYRWGYVHLDIYMLCRFDKGVCIYYIYGAFPSGGLSAYTAQALATRQVSASIPNADLLNTTTSKFFEIIEALNNRTTFRK